MQALQEQFEDTMAAQHVEACICILNQGKWSVTEYIQDFQSLASLLRDWPEYMLVSQFQEGLSNCLARAVPHDLRAWYRMATEVEIDLMESHEYTCRKAGLTEHLRNDWPPKEEQGVHL